MNAKEGKQVKKNDHIRDYATAAFRHYALMGKPTYDQLKQQIYDTILEQEKRVLVKAKGLADPTVNAQINAEKEVEQRGPELLDILAVEKTMEMLMLGGKGKIIQCIEVVYFLEPQRPIRKGEISERVIYATTHPKVLASERQVYYWLKEARRLFATVRGLRI